MKQYELRKVNTKKIYFVGSPIQLLASACRDNRKRSLPISYVYNPKSDYMTYDADIVKVPNKVNEKKANEILSDLHSDYFITER
jgi:hypothetical protein